MATDKGERPTRRTAPTKGNIQRGGRRAHAFFYFLFLDHNKRAPVSRTKHSLDGQDCGLGLRTRHPLGPLLFGERFRPRPYPQILGQVEVLLFLLLPISGRW